MEMRKKVCLLMLIALILVSGVVNALAAARTYAPIPWAYVMKKMEWTADSYSYTVGSGDQKISVVRNGSDVKISGGDIADVRFVKNDLWDESNHDYYGWHTEPGTYTFSNVVFHGQNQLFEVWANDDDVYQIVLEESVRGARVLKGSVYAGSFLNAQYNYEQALCSDLNEGRGYDYVAEPGNFALDVHVKKKASVEIINHTVIQGEYFCPVSLYMDSPEATFKLSGTGSIYTNDTPMARDVDVGENKHMFICISGRSDDEAEATVMLARMLKNNVKLDMSLFKGNKAKPMITFAYGRMGKNDPYLDLGYQTERRPVLTSVSALKKSEQQVQVVVDPQIDGDISLLETKMYWLGGNRAVCFGNLWTAAEEFAAVRGKVQLYVPYPSGIDADNADEFIFTVEYPTLSGMDMLSSKDGTIAATPYGLQFSAERMMPFELVWRKAPSQGSLEGDITGGEKEFADLPPVDVPTLVFPDGTIPDQSIILEYEKLQSPGNGTVVYNVHLIAPNGEEIDLPGECMLCFPYPEGLDETREGRYRVMIHHYGEEKTEVFKSEDGEIEFAPQGLCIRISSFSPFEITWEEIENPENLPQTGDNSSILLYGMLLMASAAMLRVVKRRMNEA